MRRKRRSPPPLLLLQLLLLFHTHRWNKRIGALGRTMLPRSETLLLFSILPARTPRPRLADGMHGIRICSSLWSIVKSFAHSTLCMKPSDPMLAIADC